MIRFDFQNRVENDFHPVVNFDFSKSNVWLIESFDCTQRVFSDKGDPNHHNSKHTVWHRPRSLCDFLYIFTIPVSRAVPLFFAIRWHAKFSLSYLFSSSPLVCIYKYTYTLSFLLFDFGVRCSHNSRRRRRHHHRYVHASVCSLFNDHHITMLPVTSIQHNGAVDTYLHNFYFIFFSFSFWPFC